MVRTTLAAVRRAGPDRLLAPAGVRLFEAAARERRALGPAVRRRQAWLESSRRGHRELRGFERLRLALRAEPVRWSWGPGGEA